MQRSQARRHDSNPPDNFGDEVTADHIVAWGDSMGVDGAQYAVAILDRATKWISAYPTGTKTAEDTAERLNQFKGNATLKRFYSDKSPELVRAARDLCWCHDVAGPGRPQFNGVA